MQGDIIWDHESTTNSMDSMDFMIYQNLSKSVMPWITNIYGNPPAQLALKAAASASAAAKSSSCRIWRLVSSLPKHQWIILKDVDNHVCTLLSRRSFLFHPFSTVSKHWRIEKDYPEWNKTFLSIKLMDTIKTGWWSVCQNAFFCIRKMPTNPKNVWDHAVKTHHLSSLGMILYPWQVKFSWHLSTWSTEETIFFGFLPLHGTSTSHGF